MSSSIRYLFHGNNIYCNKKRSTSKIINFSYSSCSIKPLLCADRYIEKSSKLGPYSYRCYEKGNNQYTMKSSFQTISGKRRSHKGMYNKIIPKKFLKTQRIIVGLKCFLLEAMTQNIQHP